MSPLLTLFYFNLSLLHKIRFPYCSILACIETR